MAGPFARCGSPQSQPVDPEMFGTKPPEYLGTANIQPFQTVPAATAPFFPPSWISLEVCSDCHIRHADTGFCPLSAARRTDVLAFPLLTKVDLACGGLLGWWRRRKKIA
jgi:hypothetical protein